MKLLSPFSPMKQEKALYRDNKQAKLAKSTARDAGVGWEIIY